jgi:hypothetical protein
VSETSRHRSLSESAAIGKRRLSEKLRASFREHYISSNIAGLAKLPVY